MTVILTKNIYLYLEGLQYLSEERTVDPGCTELLQNIVKMSTVLILQYPKQTKSHLTHLLPKNSFCPSYNNVSPCRCILQFKII